MKDQKVNADAVLALTIDELQRLRNVNTEALALACGIALGIACGQRGFAYEGASAWLQKRLLTKPSTKAAKKKVKAQTKI